jgi:thioesterase domain-containing protein
MSYHEQEINDYLACYVPLCQAMHARLERCDGTILCMKAPLSPNINDKGTAFGGAMAAIAFLTGWAMTRILLIEHNEVAEIVISSSTLRFLHPVREEIVAECKWPELPKIERFIDGYRQYGKASWRLGVTIRTTGGETALVFNGKYRIFRSDKETSGIHI